jgi:hypothetical protein
MTQRDLIARSIWPNSPNSAGDRPAPSEQPRTASALASANVALVGASETGEPAYRSDQTIVEGHDCEHS